MAARSRLWSSSVAKYRLRAEIILHVFWIVVADSSRRYINSLQAFRAKNLKNKIKCYP